MNQSFYILAAY